MSVEAGNTHFRGQVHLLIVGASARAAAWSAHQAGFCVTAADLFADRDLFDFAQAVYQLDSDTYPNCILPLVRQLQSPLPPAPLALQQARPPKATRPISALVLAGGLENHPELVAELDALLPVWGTVGRGLESVRDPFAFASALAEEGLPCAQILHQAPTVDTETHTPRHVGSPEKLRWLKKPAQSAGGRHIQFVDPTDAVSPTGHTIGAEDPRRYYYQEFLPGPSYCGIFIADRGNCRWLGTTRQWLRRDLVLDVATSDHPFSYVGSVGSFHDRHGTSGMSRHMWQAIGTALASRFALRGMFGVDAVLTTRGNATPQLVPVEVNPRYTASMEVLERIDRTSIVAHHVAAWLDTNGAPAAFPSLPTRRDRRAWGKRILFAPRDMHLSDQSLQTIQDVCHHHAPDSLLLADVPRTPTRIASGHPMLTLLASGPDTAAVERLLGFSQPSAAVSQIVQIVQ